jgi:hypothetical protein
VCLVWSRERSIYRIEQGVRGSGKVDHGAASPAAGRARRGHVDALRVQAMRLAATARSGEAWLGRIASTTAAARTGCGRRLRQRRSWVWAGRVSGGVAVSLRCSTCRGRVQGVLEVVARRVASVCPRRAHARRERRPGRVWARVVRPMSSSSATRAVLGWRRRGGGMLWRRGQGWGSKGRGGGAAWPACGRHGHAMLALSPSLAPLCFI